MEQETAILIDTAEHSSELLSKLLGPAGAANLKVRFCLEIEGGLDCLKDMLAAGNEPSAIVIGPNIEYPIAAARQIHQAAPLIEIILLADGDRAAQLQREMSIAPITGEHWTIANLDAASLARSLRDAAHSTDQRRRMRNRKGTATPAQTIGERRQLIEQLPEERDAVIAFQGAGERIQTEERIRRALEEAEQANKLKDEFLAMLSHELRTPLTPIIGWAKLIARNPDDANLVRQGIPVIVRNAQAQIQIVSDLLDMSRIITSKMRLEIQETDLSAVIASAVETVKPSAEMHDIKLVSILDSSLPPVSGDPTRLQQVFWNLLTNAIKFTPRGGQITVEMRRVNSQAEVSVTDTGVGIDPGFLPYIFGRFRQADASWTRPSGGLGLGLAIVRNLVEMHGGTVSASSEGVGRGARFTVRLPLRPSRSPIDRTAAPTDQRTTTLADSH